MIPTEYSAVRAEPSFARRGSGDIVGQYEAFIVMSHVDARIAAAALPREFELAPPSGTPSGAHPVMYSFGKHRHVHPDSLKVYEYDYDEALVGLPHVVVRGGGTPACFHMTDVRLNNRLAKDIGVALGFPKHMALIANGDTSYQISDRSTVLLQAAMQLDGHQFKEDHPHFQLIAQMMQQPVISKSGGRIITTRFTFDTAHAFMVPARMTLEVSSDSLVCLPRGRYVFDTLDHTQFDGAYMSIHSWRISQRPLIIL